MSYGFYKIEFYQLDVNDIYWLIASLIVGLGSVFLILYSYHWKTHTTWISAISTSAKSIHVNIPEKVMRGGVTPVIYVSFLTLPLMFWLYGAGATSAIVDKPYWALIIFLLLYFLGYKLLLLQSSPEKLNDYCIRNGVVLANKESVEIYLKRSCLLHARWTALYFTLLLVIGGMWSSLSPGTLSSVSYVGGIGLIILVNTIKDLFLSNRKLIEEKRYGWK
jgi:preprotein translocase subunit SecY